MKRWYNVNLLSYCHFSLPLPSDPFPSVTVSFCKGRRIKASDGGEAGKRIGSPGKIYTPADLSSTHPVEGRGLTRSIVIGFAKFEILLKATVKQIPMDGSAVRVIV